MTSAEMYAMKLHEVKKVGDDVDILRVPGGWIYTTVTFDKEMRTRAVTSCFVPLHPEFTWGNKRS